jgi:Tfp pilus tip-associated adhesin PilY1
MQEANKDAKNVIENVEGLTKTLAQKAVINEIANNSNAIIAYLNDPTATQPQLNDAAAQLFNVYKSAIAKVDQLGDQNASKEIRQKLAEKIQLVATKDYEKIKKELT